jgi:2-methylcitrate dehydratase PrpD
VRDGGDAKDDVPVVVGDDDLHGIPSIDPRYPASDRGGGRRRMAHETRVLADYAAALRYEDLPEDVVAMAKAAIVDTVGAAIWGSTLSWSRIVIAYAERSAASGNARILGANTVSVQPGAAALANGALAHAFELDCLTRPGAGVHPGASLLPPALAMAQQEGRSGRDLIAAFVAGSEVMIRIGRASRHANETRGFHAPGTTGPFGAAVAAAHLLRLGRGGMANALGIAGSLAGGLLEFASAGTGGMVKRLHIGRAAESGVLAASLAQDGFTAPDTILEGSFGFLNVFCGEGDAAALTEGLGREFATRSISFKRFACHVTAQAAVAAARALQDEHGFAAAEIAEIGVAGSARMVERHAIAEPADLMLAQYSLPFCVALALHRDPAAPESFAEDALADPAIRALARRVRVVRAPEGASADPWASTLTVTLADGRVLRRDGVTEDRPSPALLDEKFARLTRGVLAERGGAFRARLDAIETEDRLDWIGVEAAG